MEEWKDIAGYEGYYQINANGLVRSLDRYVRCGRNGNGIKILKGRNMRPYVGTDGYLYFLLTVHKVSKHFALHRLLALSFIPNPEGKREVNHIDTNRLNNSLDNLEWATPSENINHSIRMGTNTQCLPGERNPAAKLTSEDVLKIRSEDGTHAAIAAKFNISRRSVTFIKQKKRWAHL